jgi:predicted CXXCH cytochrome family protein
MFYSTTKLSAITGYLSLVFSVLLGQSVMAGTLAGSKHDFSIAANGGWSGGEICVPCHTPHNGQTGQDKQLWNHAETQSVFTPYESGSLNADKANNGQPGGVSKLCLSCHDGTVALDAFGGAAGTTPMTGSTVLGTDLSDDHPISIIYNKALADLDGSLRDPTTAQVTIGDGGVKTKTGSIDAVLLSGGTVQCSSCHDVHNAFVADPTEPLLKVTKKESQLCLVCHDK